MDPLEYIWDNLLSRSPKRIRAVFKNLDEASQREVISHLNKMVSEEGWQPEQIASAKAALAALSQWQDDPDQSN